MSRPICTICNARIEKLNEPFCPVCGEGFIPVTGGQPDMRYKKIDLNEYGKALVCPHCENEELTRGDYCKICGNDIINRCADTPDPKMKSLVVKSCKTLLEGNARYCSKCGNESAFFQHGWLKDWRSENTKKAIRNMSSKDNTISFSEIKEEKAN